MNEARQEVFGLMANDERIGDDLWATCMAAEGFSGVTSVDDLVVSFSERLNALTSSSPDDSALLALAEEEAAAASASRACDKHAVDTFLSVLYEYELRYLADHPELGTMP